MDTTKRSTSRRHHQPPGIPPSPRLHRSKSGGTLAQSQIHPSPTNNYYYYSPQISTIHRSKSTTKSRTNPNQENFNPIKKPQDQNKDNGNGFAKFWQSNSANSNASKRVRQGPTSPSAWALSPGRSLPVTPKSSGRVGSGSGVSGVLKYFRNRKVGSSSLVQQVEYGEYRVSYNRLLQWRFVNARAEASMASVKMLAQKKMFNVWVRILVVRNSIMEMRIEMQKLKNEIKLYKIINSQASLLKEWKRLEGRNCEAVGRVARKLSSTSIRIPLLHGAKADAEAMYEAMSTANIVMANIEATIMQFHSQVEKVCYLLTELTIIGKQQKEYFLEEMDKSISMVASFEAVEKSLRVHLIQLLTESRRIEGGLNDPNIHRHKKYGPGPNRPLF